jgi:Single-strand binding protein family
MQNINRVLLTGNLTKDPDQREFRSGGSVCSLRLAVNEISQVAGVERISVGQGGRTAVSLNQSCCNRAKRKLVGNVPWLVFLVRRGGGHYLGSS